MTISPKEARSLLKKLEAAAKAMPPGRPMTRAEIKKFRAKTVEGIEWIKAEIERLYDEIEQFQLALKNTKQLLADIDKASEITVWQKGKAKAFTIKRKSKKS